MLNLKANGAVGIDEHKQHYTNKLLVLQNSLLEFQS